MSKFIVKVDHIPNFQEYSTDRAYLLAKLKLLPGLLHIHLWDRQYYYVSHSDWGRIFEDVLQNMPKYTKTKFDCDNFTMLVSARVNEKYKVNTCGIATGQGPSGPHAFNIFFSEEGLFFLEPQTGEVFAVEEDSGYKAE